MELKIKELCDERGIKTAYDLAKKANLKMPTAYRAYANDIKQFTIETLEALCAVLECSPNDIFGVESARNVRVKATESRSDGSESVKGKSVSVELPEGDVWLSTLEVAERLKVSRKSVNDYIIDGKLPATKGKQNHNFIKLDDVLIFETVYKSGE